MKIFVFLFLTSSACFALESFDYSIQMGEKTTRYFLKDSTTSTLVKSVSGQSDRTIKLEDDNKKLLFEQIQEISKLQSNDLKLCRNGVLKIEFNLGKKWESKLGCINSLNSTSQKLTVLANLLGYL